MIDVVIIGAGPAGLKAAITCATYDLHVKVIDEFVKPGGRLLGQLHEEPNGTWWNGIEQANNLLEQATANGVTIDCGVSVHHLEKTTDGWVIHTNKEQIISPTVLLATGAAEYSTPIQGWTLPGVMSIGAAQVMTNVHRVKVGQRGIVIGLNVLSFAIARELQLAGIELASIVPPKFSQITKETGHPHKIMDALLKYSHLAPSVFLRFGSKLIKNQTLQRIAVDFYPKSGISVWGIPLHLRTAAVEIFGETKVEGVKLVNITSSGEPIKGTERELLVDFVCISGGLYPLAELAAVAGCPFYYISELGGHIPLHNERMETPLEGLYVAGNITGIESSKVAIAQGNTAGLSIVSNLMKNNEAIEEKVNESIVNIEQVRHNSIIQFHPGIKKGRKQLNKLWNDYKCQYPQKYKQMY
ncbi:NAD(P)/FAD-dependent oxidoreductase [Bacillus sp. SM2101]|uniref:NAD(P)/FAD-dependent oxidoreductase n=1 Tax=Bacillus sp. SM2101 TaxID=2805366 RepID=UPI001BDE5A4D|nr:NAD(P)/FAD-dependent oxidoreductase [Bacillus sp. SM2101]